MEITEKTNMNLSQMKEKGKLWKPKSKAEAIWAIRFFSFVSGIEKDVKKNVAHYLDTSCKECEEYFDENGNGIRRVTREYKEIEKDEYYLAEEERIKKQLQALKEYGETLPTKVVEKTHYRSI